MGLERNEASVLEEMWGVLPVWVRMFNLEVLTLPSRRAICEKETSTSSDYHTQLLPISPRQRIKEEPQRLKGVSTAPSRRDFR